MKHRNRIAFFSKGYIFSIGLSVITMTAPLLFPTIPDNIKIILVGIGVALIVIATYMHIRDWWSDRKNLMVSDKSSSKPMTPLEHFQYFISKKIEQINVLKQDSSLNIAQINVWREQTRLGIRSATGKNVMHGNDLGMNIAILYPNSNTMSSTLDKHSFYLKKLLHETPSAELHQNFNPIDLAKY